MEAFTVTGKGLRKTLGRGLESEIQEWETLEKPGRKGHASAG